MPSKPAKTNPSKPGAGRKAHTHDEVIAIVAQQAKTAMNGLVMLHKTNISGGTVTLAEVEAAARAAVAGSWAEVK